jgi:ketosteroid isomerase-like protein
LALVVVRIKFGVTIQQEQSIVKSEEAAIRKILEQWAAATREGRQDNVLKNHLDDLVIFDVLPPMRYESAAAYRASWGDWQPDAQGEMTFELEDLSISAGDDCAFAFGMLQSGGTPPNGKLFRDTVRITFCLRKTAKGWKVAHQHVSKPFAQG